MTPQKFRVQIGTKMIEDMLDPKPEELDLDAIEDNLRRTYRFASAPGSLNVHQHRMLVVRLVQLDQAFETQGFEVDDRATEMWNHIKQWAQHHDDHEAIIGDIVAPVKALISAKTNILEIVEVKIDRAICAARGFEYPSETVRGLVHRYDKAAETLEWIHALGRPATDWNHACPDHLMKQGKKLINWARMLT